MLKQKFIVKVDRFNELTLFFPELRARSGFIVCWCASEGHNEACTDYYRAQRNPAPGRDAELAALVARYERLPGEPVRLVRVRRDSEKMRCTRAGCEVPA